MRANVLNIWRVNPTFSRLLKRGVTAVDPGERLGGTREEPCGYTTEIGIDYVQGYYLGRPAPIAGTLGKGRQEKVA